METPVQKEHIATKTVKGIFWSSLSLVGGKGFSFISTLVLARLLLPEQFGLMGYCLVVIQYLDVLNSAGIGLALISQQEHFEEAANASFIANLFLGIITFLIMWLTAPFVSSFFREDGLIPLLRVLAFTLPISALGMVPDAVIQRNIRFKTRFIPEISRSLIKGIVAIVLAITGFGVWSLVLGQLASVFVGVILNWILGKWKPTWKFHPEVNRGIFLFAINILIMDFSGVFTNNIDYMFVGRILGTAALGYYTMAYRIPELIINSVNTAVGTVSFPVLSSIQRETDKMQDFYFSYVKYLALFVFPVGIGLAVVSPLLIPIFLSQSWYPAVLPAALISLALCIGALGYIPGVLYKSIGRPEILNYLAIVKTPVMVGILWYSARWGIAGVAAGQVACACILLSIDSLYVNYLMKYKIIDMFKSIFPSVISAVIMGLVLAFTYYYFSPDGIVGLLFMILLGIIVYFLTITLIGRETVLQGIKIMKDSLKISR